jgi:hypothetical protein
MTLIWLPSWAWAPADTASRTAAASRLKVIGVSIFTEM